MMGESVTIKVNLDITQSKREIEEQKKSVQKQEETIDRVRGKFKKSFQEGKDLYSTWGMLDPEARAKESSRSFNRYMLRRQGEDPSGDFSLTPSGLSKATGLDQLTPKNMMGENMSSAVASGLKGGATLYAGIRLGNTLGVGLMEALKGALPGLEGSAAFDAIQKQVDSMARAIDDFENRIIGMVTAASNIYELGKAGANMSGGQPIEYSIYANQEYDIAVAEGNLDRAFDRFKNKNMARSFGSLWAEANKRLSQ